MPREVLPSPIYKPEFLKYISILFCPQVIVNGKPKKSYLNMLNKLLENNEHRLRVIRDLYGPKNIFRSPPTISEEIDFQPETLSGADDIDDKPPSDDEIEEKPLLLVVMLNVSTYSIIYKYKTLCTLLLDRICIGLYSSSYTLIYFNSIMMR